MNLSDQDTASVEKERIPGLHLKHPACLISLCDGEWNDFFPGTLREELEAILPGLTCVKSDKINWDSWKTLLNEVSPEIIITGWSSPSIPEGYFGQPHCRLKYVCHLTGQVKAKVPRDAMVNGLLVTNWGNSISHTVAEHALCLLLASLRRLTHFTATIRDDEALRDKDVQTLFGKRVGIHGFGQVARDLARLLQCFEVEISAFAPEIPSSLMEDLSVERKDSLMELFQENSIVIELEGLNDETRGMVREEHLRALPSGGVFVNCGRAGVVDEAALNRVAGEGKLQFGLDVLHKEPIPSDSPLRGLRNVTITPHIAGPVPEIRRVCGRFVLDNLRRYLNGEALHGRVSLAHYDRMT